MGRNPDPPSSAALWRRDKSTMEKEGHAQLELFSQDQGLSYIRPRNKRAPLSYIRGYEKIILIFAAFMVTALISFSLGVEKGKRLFTSAIKSQYLAETQKIAPPQSTPAAPAPVAAAQQSFIVSVKSVPQSAAGKFTIQVATFKTAALAQKEAEFLKKKGFTVRLSSSGAYVVLCAGNFSNKETAKPVLAKLKKQYDDCFIRRL